MRSKAKKRNLMRFIPQSRAGYEHKLSTEKYPRRNLVITNIPVIVAVLSLAVAAWVTVISK
jgi:hypothetical protein